MTKRPTVPVMEDLIDKQIDVLDHGFVRVVDYMGDDAAIVQAARVSYGSGTKHVSEDTNLIRYMMRHRHNSPFEMCEIKLHVKLPIFVARQWIRHRIGSYNEYSARYSVMDKEFYIPELENIQKQSNTNKQGRDEQLDTETARMVLDILTYDATHVYRHYENMLEEGVARELVRMNLSLNYYTQWYWKTNLRSLFNFLSLRADSHAQYEIRVYAEAILAIVRAWVPIAYQAFLDYDMNSFTMSTQMQEVLNKFLDGGDISDNTLSKREFTELAAKFPKLLEV